MHFYKHNIGDYRRDTAHLTLIEHGAYRQLLDTYYLHEQPIPLETEQVFRRLLARTEDERTAVLAVLSEFFTKTEAGWVHTRCDDEIAVYQGRVERAREAGKTGGRPRKETEEERVSVSDQSLSETDVERVSKANHKPRTKNQKPLVKDAPDGVEAAVWSDFTALRKRRGADVTETVINGITGEAKKAGITLNAALTECVVRGWQSFKADWYLRDNPKSRGGEIDWGLEKAL